MPSRLGQDEAGRDRRDLIQPRLAKCAHGIVSASKSKTAMDLDAGVGRLQVHLGGKIFGKVYLRPAGLALIEQVAGLRREGAIAEIRVIASIAARA